MDTKYSEKYFINPAIEYGIRSYIALKNGEAYNKAYTFELAVIKTLTIIYGEKSILLPYKIDNEKAFECNLLMYDLKELDMHNLIKYLNDYYDIMSRFKSEAKATGLIYEIERILIEMINKRAKKQDFSPEELAAFDKLFNPINGDINSIKDSLSNQDGLIKKYWSESKVELTNTQARMIAINPELLSSDTYKKFGYDIRTVASLSEKEIKDVNKTIMDEENRFNEANKPSLFARCNLSFSTGNGFVDKLLILAIASTELMVGAIILASLIGGK